MSIVAQLGRRLTQGVLLFLFLFQVDITQADSLPGGDLEFFEKHVRPLLADRCFKCHSEQSEKLKGGLKVDSRAALLRGGETKPALVPGHPEQSLLIEAINYSNPDLQMPPKIRLSTEEIEALTLWVKHGAPWPSSALARVATAPTNAAAVFDLEKRKQDHWAWSPILKRTLPNVINRTWSANPVDQFVLAKLEASKMAPAPDAERRTLIRRVYFDLIGLPPTPDQVAQFAANESPQAYSELVDQLLASPRFGERWGRHWLDLVRYAETLGHEFDYEIPNSFRYRDYVIRALNDDVPYDHFLREHLAGDLLEHPRINSVSGLNESVIGPGFFWFGQQTHSPVDVRLHQSELIDNQIDVMTKTFLGLTVACARCHDHKFDPIPTRDYYSLYGILSSSRYAQRPLFASGKFDEITTRVSAAKAKLATAMVDSWRSQSHGLTNYLAALRVSNPQLDPSLRTNKLTALKQALEAQSKRASHPQTLPKTAWASAAEPKSFQDWLVDGEAFRDALVAPNEIIFLGADHHPVLAVEPMLHSAKISNRLQGAIRSPTFTITNRYIHLRVAGRESRFNLMVDNFNIVQDPIYGTLRRVLDRDELSWTTIDLERWKGHRAYIDLSDTSTRDLASSGKSSYSETGWTALSHVVLSEDSKPPELGTTLGAVISDSSILGEVEIELTRIKDHSSEPAGLVSSLVRFGFFDLISSEHPSFKDLIALEKLIPPVVRVPSMADGNGLDENIFVRGNPKLIGENAPRRFLEAVDGKSRELFSVGSGRRELAERLLDSGNPFTARVMVNRVWLHLFGRGIVPTPDDFGVLGQAPTHPQLLDWLADNYRSNLGWSNKKLIKLLVTSRTYRMSSRAGDSRAEELDPNNLLWHRMPIKRLEGEVIRDAMLALSGRLDQTMYGSSVPVHLTEFMDGRGKPGQSGPLDGARRRSIYLEVRRNFLSPLMRNFDTPIPFSTVGRRTVSNVPAQSLILLNDPFIKEESMFWAKRALATMGDDPEGLVRHLYREAFGREPTDEEQQGSKEFLAQQSKAYGATGNDPASIADLCHVLFNVKSFIYLN